ncbi:MAG TPA: cell wall hydrolase [Candidatus Paceibacterota bacterium]|jgi:spore germination cell wall hydrolase CwlJ-like protein|nr:cell wall hydrolase [Candidatus Paceibacterota bacterium]
MRTKVRRRLNAIVGLIIMVATVAVGLDFVMQREAKKAFIEGEIACLKEALYYEGRGGIVLEQLLQGMIILARVADKDPQWPKTICGAVAQDRQFSYYSDEDVLNRPIERAAMARADMLAKRLYFGAWKTQFLPRGWECVRFYKVSDAKLTSMDEKHLAQLKVSKRSLGYFGTLRAVATIGSHTFYRDPERCVTPLPTT